MRKILTAITVVAMTASLTAAAAPAFAEPAPIESFGEGVNLLTLVAPVDDDWRDGYEENPDGTAETYTAPEEPRNPCEGPFEYPSAWTPSRFKYMGVIDDYSEWHYTWYSSRTAPHHDRWQWVLCDDNLWRTPDGYIVVACQSLPYGATVPTPFGEGLVLDCGCDYGTVDIYVGF